VPVICHPEGRPSARSRGIRRRSPEFRHKHVRIDQRELDRARRILEAQTETDAALRRAKGRANITKAFY
jgi:hypothetical protein